MTKKKEIWQNMDVGKKLPADMEAKLIAAIPAIPDYATYFEHFMVDEKGYIYVFIVVVEENDRRKMDIFSPKGKYLYRLGLAFPGGCRFKSKNIVIKGSHLFVVQECKKGSFKLVKYKINRVF